MTVLKAMASVSWFPPLGADDGSLDGHIFFMVQSWISINQVTNSVTAGLKKSELVKTSNYFWQSMADPVFFKLKKKEKKKVMDVFVVESSNANPYVAICISERLLLFFSPCLTD